MGQHVDAMELLWLCQRFAGDRGEFRGRDSDDGREVEVRFVWNRLGADAARWEQAFSLDGREWETNWTMDFKRA